MGRKKILELISLIGSIASIVSLFWAGGEWNPGKIALAISIAVVAVAAAVGLIFNRETKICKNEKEINDFMKHWIQTDGVVKVFSRDLSWVDDDMLGIIRKKGGDLYFYVQSKNRAVEAIRQVNPGCRIYYYGDYGFEPISRYTVIHANRDTRQIAVALQEKKGFKNMRHEIYISEDSAYDKKMLGLAMDLMSCIECMEAKSEKNGKENRS